MKLRSDMHNFMKPDLKQQLAGRIPIVNLRLGVFAGVLMFLLGLSGQSFSAPGKLNSFNPPGVPDVTNPNTQLTIVVNNAVADGVSTNTVNAHIVDNSGNPVVGVQVSFSVTGSSTTSVAITTNGTGDAAISFTSTVAGNSSVVAQVSNQSITFGSPAVVTFIAGPADGANCRLNMYTNNQLADGSSQDMVYAHIVDQFGNIIVGQAVVFSISSGTGSFATGNTITTDPAGNALVRIVSNVVGQVGITATVNGQNVAISSPILVTFVDGPVSASSSTLSVLTNNALANSGNTNSVQATIMDAYGHPLANQTVTFSITSGTGSFVGSSTVTTDASGNAAITLTSTVVGSVGISASIGGNNITGSPVTVNFTSGPPDGALSRLNMYQNNQLADGVSQDMVYAHIVDANGNKIVGQAVVFSIASGTGSFATGNTIVTDLGGNALVRIVSNVVGQVGITATVNGQNVAISSPILVTFVIGPVSPSASTLSVLTNNAVADGSSTNSVQALIMDAYGHPIANQAVVFSIASGTGTFVGSTTVNTDASGVAMISLTSTVAGQVNINASVGGVNIGGSPQTVTFIAGAFNANASVLSVNTNNAAADGTSTNSVKAHITDVNNNPIAGQTVTFAIISGTGTFIGSTNVTTDASGNAIIQLTSTVAGQVSLTASVGGTGLPNVSPAVVTFVPAAPSTSSPATLLTVVINNVVADGSSTNSVLAHISDINGNSVPNQQVIFTIASGTASFVGSSTVTTDASGNAVISLTSLVAGQVNITATVGGNNITNGSPAVVTFVAGPVSASASKLSVVADNAIADGTSTNSIQAHITDANGNPIANQSVVFTIASGTGSFVGSATVTTDINGNAVISLTSTVVGQVGITATVGGNNIATGSPATVTFISGTPDPNSPATVLTVVANNAAADGASTNSVKAHIADINGNPVANQTVVFSIASGTGNIVGSGTVTTNASGDAVITLTSTVVGQVGITATVAGNNIPNGSPAVVTFVTGPVSASASKLSVVTNNAVADGTSTNSVQALVTDAGGNPIANQSVVFAIASGNGTFVGSTTVTTNASGIATISLTSTVAGQVGITASVGGNNITTGSPAVVTFVAGPVSTSVSALTIVNNNAAPNGTSTNSVQAHITDANGNPIANQSVVFAIASGTGTFVGSTTVVTDANGNATIALTSTVPGQVGITATVGGNSITTGSPAVVTFVSIPDFTNVDTRLIVVVPEAPADGQTATSVKAHIVDQVGNPMPGLDVTFTIDSGTGQIITPQPVTTDANGDAIIEITSSQVGYVLIKAAVGTQSIVNESPARVKFVPINIYVPKVFTPNGDGTNDVLKPVLAGIATFNYFSVYNRWGNLVFKTSDPGTGWDGTYKGVKQPVETYIWIAEGVDTNGKTVVQKGMVSLLR